MRDGLRWCVVGELHTLFHPNLEESSIMFPRGIEKFGYSHMIIPPYMMENDKDSQLISNFQFLDDWSIC